MASLYKSSFIILASIASALTLSNAATSKKLTSKQYSGAVFDGVLPYNGLVASATGTLIVPAVRLPAKADPHQVYEGAAAVGMYGYECTGGFVSASVAWAVRNQTVEYGAYLTNGSLPANRSSVKVSKGDQVQLSTFVYGGGGAAQATIDNLSTGQSQSVYFDVFNPPPNCNRTAEWVVIDPVTFNGKPFAAFNQVNFTSASYDSFDPVNYLVNRGLTNVTAINLVNNANTVLAAGSIPSSNNITVAFKQAA